MLICMRTTLILPDDLYREVKLLAAQDRRTVTSVVEEALRAAVLRHRAAAAPAETPFRVAPSGSGGLQPGVDLSDSAGLLDVMGER